MAAYKQPPPHNKNHLEKSTVAIKYFNNKDACITQDLESGGTPNSLANIIEGKSFTTAGFTLLRVYTSQKKTTLNDLDRLNIKSYQRGAPY